MYESEIKSMVIISRHLVITCSILGTLSSRINPNPLSWNKMMRNISLDVDLMGMIILKLGPECFSDIYSNFVLYKVR
jgi:Ca2+/Na+ antiporter